VGNQGRKPISGDWRMLNLLGSEHHLCDGISRRDFLQIGSLGAAGIAMPELFRGSSC
jgi:hypothetical protein